jgi:hypothetical protein
MQREQVLRATGPFADTFQPAPSDVLDEPWKRGDEVIGEQEAAEVGPKRNEQAEVGPTYRGHGQVLDGLVENQFLRARLEFSVKVGHDVRMRCTPVCGRGIREWNS